MNATHDAPAPTSASVHGVDAPARRVGVRSTRRRTGASCADAAATDRDAGGGGSSHVVTAEDNALAAVAAPSPNAHHAPSPRRMFAPCRVKTSSTPAIASRGISDETDGDATISISPAAAASARDGHRFFALAASFASANVVVSARTVNPAGAGGSAPHHVRPGVETASGASEAAVVASSSPPPPPPKRTHAAASAPSSAYAATPSPLATPPSALTREGRTSTTFRRPSALASSPPPETYVSEMSLEATAPATATRVEPAARAGATHRVPSTPTRVAAIGPIVPM